MTQFDFPSLPDELLNEEKVVRTYEKLNQLMEAIDPRTIPSDVKMKIQACLSIVAETAHEKKPFLKALHKSNNTIVRLLEKHLKLVPKNYYQVLWMSVGMAAFGIPLGVAFSAALNNYAFIGLGLPIGLGIGLALGVTMDKKAKAEGRQLPVDI